jgi:hypothetical protein
MFRNFDFPERAVARLHQPRLGGDDRVFLGEFSYRA